MTKYDFSTITGVFGSERAHEIYDVVFDRELCKEYHNGSPVMRNYAIVDMAWFGFEESDEREAFLAKYSDERYMCEMGEVIDNELYLSV